MQDRAKEEGHQRVGIAVTAVLSAAFGVAWLAGLGRADVFVLGFGELFLGFAPAYPTPRVLGPGFPRIGLADAAFAALLSGLLTGVAGFLGPSGPFFWGIGFGFALVAARWVTVA